MAVQEIGWVIARMKSGIRTQRLSPRAAVTDK
eukprot:CAMPEP_0170634228 /NCGR_PEP_ID=MMETSP0224-20130122/36473_1 /TAXON_ID=285029 /ORGANISM="Togula jolla, Strain CCCM 725" /LENGTH=31 /DNA_ID= /DNA_START= /DNA_END= /DNA_ORIENTATION=